MASDYEVILNDEDILENDLSVSTDLDDYAPGSTAKITATGVAVGGTISFEVDHVSGPGDDGVYGTSDDAVAELDGAGHDSWSVTDGGAGDLDGEANGTIVTDWYVNPDDSLDETFLLSADSGTDTAFWSFTDSIPAGYVPPRGSGVPTTTVLDLTALDSPDFQDARGTVWTNDIFGAGTGVISPFLRTQATGNADTQDGVNTSGDLNNDEKA